MEHIGRVRRRGTQTDGAPRGDVDVWAGPVLEAKRRLPPARGVFSAARAQARSQNRVEEEILTDAGAATARPEVPAIAAPGRVHAPGGARICRRGAQSGPRERLGARGSQCAGRSSGATGLEDQRLGLDFDVPVRDRSAG